MIWAFDFSPDGEYARVTKLEKPFSYIVPVSNFARTEEIWDRTGKVLHGPREDPHEHGAPGRQRRRARRRRRSRRRAPPPGGVARGQPGPDVPRAGSRARRRQRGGRRAGAAARGARGTGQEGGRARRKDRVMQWLPPFDSASLKVVYESDTRMTSHNWSPDYQTLFLSERQGQNVHEYAVRLSDAEDQAHAGALRRRRLLRQPGLPRPHGRRACPAGAGFGGFGAAAGAVAARPCSSPPTASTSSSTAPQYDKDPLTNAPKSFLDEVAIDGGAKQRVYESSNDEPVGAHHGAAGRRRRLLRGGAGVVRPRSRRLPARRREPDTQLTENKDYTPDLTVGEEGALRGGAPRRLPLHGQRDAAPRLHGRAPAGHVLVLPPGVRDQDEVRRDADAPTTRTRSRTTAPAPWSSWSGWATRWWSPTRPSWARPGR